MAKVWLWMRQSCIRLSEEISQKRLTLRPFLSLTLFPFTLSSIRDGPPLEGNYIKSLAELISLRHPSPNSILSFASLLFFSALVQNDINFIAHLMAAWV
jgi:hypothetical protein